MLDKKAILIGGTFVEFPENSVLFTFNDDNVEDGVFFLEKGKAELYFKKKDGKRFKIILNENSLFGLPEIYAEIPRVTEVRCIENCTLYKWTKSGFLLAVSMSWELSLLSINSLSKLLKILNFEYMKV